MFRIVIAALFAVFANVSAAQEISDDRVKQLALEAILENPEIIMEAVAILEQRQRDAQAAAAATMMGSVADETNAPIIGNPDGDVVIVEFFDYNCPYCRRAGEVLSQVLDTDANVKVVLREWPILGPESVVAACASLAARNQDNYEAFHWALMNGSGRATEATIMRTARDVGLDVDQLQADMNSDAVNDHIAKSTELAQAFGFTGTPAFVIGDEMAPGFIELAQMQDLIQRARGN